MTSPAPRCLLVGQEDDATAGAVATAAAHLTVEQDATVLILLHVIGTHMVAGGLRGLLLGLSC